MRKVAINRKARDKIDNEMQDLLQFVSVFAWLWFLRSFINPYIFKLARNMIFFHFEFCKQIWGVERAALSFATPLATGCGFVE